MYSEVQSHLLQKEEGSTKLSSEQQASLCLFLDVGRLIYGNISETSHWRQVS